MYEHDMSDRAKENRAVEHAFEDLVEALEDVNDTQREREEFLNSTPRPTPPREFENLQAFLDYHWQVQTYKEAEEERNQEVTRAVDEHQRATQALLHLLPFEVPLHYTYQGERDRLQNQPYRIVKIAEGLQVHKQTP